MQVTWEIPPMLGGGTAGENDLADPRETPLTHHRHDCCWLALRWIDRWLRRSGRQVIASAHGRG